MDDRRFDSFVKALSSAGSRRGVLGIFGASALGLGAFVRPGLSAAKKRNKKCKKKCGPCKKCKKGKCKPKPDGTDCGGTKVCQSGACMCPTECCADADCGGLRECVANGSCAVLCADIDCPTAACSCTTSVEGSRHCIVGLDCDDLLQECTSTADCPPGQHCQSTGCGPGGTLTDRCTPLCQAD
jgi:hypothetical protein